MAQYWFPDTDPGAAVEFIDRMLVHPSRARRLSLSVPDLVVIRPAHPRPAHAKIVSFSGGGPRASIKGRALWGSRRITVTPPPQLTLDEVNQSLANAGVIAGMTPARKRRFRQLRVVYDLPFDTGAEQLVEIVLNAMRALGVQPGDDGWWYEAISGD